MKRVARWLPDPIIKPLRRHRDSVMRSQIESILEQTAAPSTSRAEADFDLLQSEFCGVPEYGFDFHSTWKRASQRAILLADVVPDKERSYRVLEVGCGDAMTGYMLSTHGHEVSVSDMDDWRNPAAKSLPFTKAVLEEGLPFEEASFDFIFSFNSFEHFNDPGRCFAELTRLTRPGGIVYLSFGPIYASAWGLHAASSFKMPFPQYLFSKEFLQRKLQQTGVYDLGKHSDSLQPLNAWTVKEFCELWNENPAWRVLMEDLWGPDEFLPVIKRYPECFTGRNLTFEDVVTQAINVTLGRQLA